MIHELIKFIIAYVLCFILLSVLIGINASDIGAFMILAFVVTAVGWVGAKLIEFGINMYEKYLINK